MTPVGREIMEAAKDLRFIIQYGAGVEGVDMDSATERGILVSNIPSAHTGNAHSCAEHAIFLTLGLLRNFHAMQQSVRERGLGRPLGTMLRGRTVLVVGFGNIAQCLIPLLKAFGVRVICVRRQAWPEESADSAVAGAIDARGTTAQYPELLPSADVVIVTCPQTPENRGFVNRAFLSHCKDGVRIVNVARGGLLDYEACREGLASGRIGGLGLDVQWVEPFDPEDPIATDPRVLLTPHIAGVTDVSYRNMARIVAEEASKIRRGELPSLRGQSQLLNTRAVDRAMERLKAMTAPNYPN